MAGIVLTVMILFVILLIMTDIEYKETKYELKELRTEISELNGKVN